MEATDATPRPKRHPLIRFGGRAVLSLVLMWVLISQLPNVELADLKPEWNDSSVYWLAGAAAMKFLAFCLSTLRWGYVVDALAKPPRFRRLLSHFLAGQFVSNLLPTAFGGDVIRVSRLGRDIGDMPRSFASVAIDRLTGWLVLPIISIAAIATSPGLQNLGRATATAMAINVSTLIGLVVVITVAANRRFARDIDTMTGWKRFFIAVHLGIDALRSNRKDAAEVVGSGILFQVTQSLAVWLAARAISLDEVTVGAALAFFPPTAIIQNVPLGLGGLGVREASFVLFFGAAGLGAPSGQVITLGLLVYALTLGTSALGAPAFMFGAVSPKEALGGFADDPPP